MTSLVLEPLRYALQRRRYKFETENEVHIHGPGCGHDLSKEHIHSGGCCGTDALSGIELATAIADGDLWNEYESVNATISATPAAEASVSAHYTQAVDISAGFSTSYGTVAEPQASGAVAANPEAVLGASAVASSFARAPMYETSSLSGYTQASWSVPDTTTVSHVPMALSGQSYQNDRWQSVLNVQSNQLQVFTSSETSLGAQKWGEQASEQGRGSLTGYSERADGKPSYSSAWENASPSTQASARFMGWASERQQSEVLTTRLQGRHDVGPDPGAGKRGNESSYSSTQSPVNREAARETNDSPAGLGSAARAFITKAEEFVSSSKNARGEVYNGNSDERTQRAIRSDQAPASPNAKAQEVVRQNLNSTDFLGSREGSPSDAQRGSQRGSQTVVDSQRRHGAEPQTLTPNNVSKSAGQHGGETDIRRSIKTDQRPASDGQRLQTSVSRHSSVGMRGDTDGSLPASTQRRLQTAAGISQAKYVKEQAMNSNKVRDPLRQGAGDESFQHAARSQRIPTSASTRTDVPVQSQPGTTIRVRSEEAMERRVGAQRTRGDHTQKPDTIKSSRAEIRKASVDFRQQQSGRGELASAIDPIGRDARNRSNSQTLDRKSARRGEVIEGRTTAAARRRADVSVALRRAIIGRINRILSTTQKTRNAGRNSLHTLQRLDVATRVLELIGDEDYFEGVAALRSRSVRGLKRSEYAAGVTRSGRSRGSKIKSFKSANELKRQREARRARKSSASGGQGSSAAIGGASSGLSKSTQTGTTVGKVSNASGSGPSKSLSIFQAKTDDAPDDREDLPS
jgi:hypothetical protein